MLAIVGSIELVAELETMPLLPMTGFALRLAQGIGHAI